MKSVILLDVMTCSLVEGHRHFGGMYCSTLPVTYFLLVSCLAYSWTLKTDAAHSSKMSANIYHTTRVYTPENNILQLRYADYH
jgi:hypothetical protein